MGVKREVREIRELMRLEAGNVQQQIGYTHTRLNGHTSRFDATNVLLTKHAKQIETLDGLIRRHEVHIGALSDAVVAWCEIMSEMAGAYMGLTQRLSALEEAYLKTAGRRKAPRKTTKKK